ncbi:MAG TPA: right-handed parallel beta-helix repeat-containing protein [Gaiellaceae bacterium]
MRAATAVAVAGLALVIAGGASAGGTMIFASPNGSGSACTANAPCSLATAVASAPAGSTVKALPGVYQGGVSFSKQLDLEGPAAVLDATTSQSGYGIEVSGPGGSGSVIAGWTVMNAQFAGILVGSHVVDALGNPLFDGSPIDDVTVDHVTVVDNDKGFSDQVGQGAGECHTTPFAPGDCGEGIHLVSATNSTVEHSLIQDNAGGILMTDEFGPATGNTISYDSALDNTDDCGITIASHSPFQIYGNTIDHNVADGNGVAGQGAGILMAGAAAGTGVHDNTVSNNEASGNGLAGIVIHDHFPGNFNNNVITNNHLGNNNLDGDFDFLTPDPYTTDILVAAGWPFPGPPPLPPITGTVIANNQISDAEVGIWTLNVAGSTVQNNHFHNVTTPISDN